jgi:hypothetical protein
MHQLVAANLFALLRVSCPADEVFRARLPFEVEVRPADLIL